MKKSQIIIALVLTTVFAFQAAAENEGQSFLDDATEKKLTARTLADLEAVAKLCETALEEKNTITNGYPIMKKPRLQSNRGFSDQSH